MGELFTVMETAKKLKTTKQRIYRLIKAGHIKAIKLGDLKIPADEINRFITESIGKDYTDEENVKELVF